MENNDFLTPVNYVGRLKEELDCFKRNGISYELQEHELDVKVNGDGTNAVTFSMTFNKVLLSATGPNKKVAKQLCYKEVFTQKLIG